MTKIRGKNNKMFSLWTGWWKIWKDEVRLYIGYITVSGWDAVDGRMLVEKSYALIPYLYLDLTGLL